MTQTVAIMQPYFVPYLGYFQLIAASDCFVFYDDAQFIKGGYVNRNRIHPRGGNSWFTLSVEHAAHELPIMERHYHGPVASNVLIARLKNCYAKAPEFASVMPLLSEILGTDDRNVAQFNIALIEAIARHVGLHRPFIRSSQLDIDRSTCGRDRVIAICKHLEAMHYINASGGRALYDRADFASQGMGLSFIEPVFPRYPQFGEEFIPGLSIIDVLMFNSREKVREMIEDLRLAP